MMLTRRTASYVVLLAVAALMVSKSAPASSGSGPAPDAIRSHAPPLAPIDPQDWVFPQNQTWADYSPVPGTDWGNPALVPSIQKWDAALVVVDFPDQPFVISRPVGSTIFGNPQPGAPAVARDNVPEFYRDFLNTPSMLNHFVTINKYWMENSLGRYGVQLDAFGPYSMPGNQFEYFLNDAGGAGSSCPSGFTCNRNIRTDARAAWVAEVGTAVADSYDNVFYMNAGQDESSTWQEFGEMMFQTMNDVTEPFGNPDETKPNWAPTRYIPWTSFKAAQSNWPNASGNTSTEAESSGMGVFAHELSHNLGIGDNYNNPYSNPPRRAYSGPWDMLSRGSFNGPGGPHKRWFIPSSEGGALGSNHNLRNRMKLAFVTEANLLRLDRNGLASSGLVVAKVTARAADPGPTGLTGINVILTGGDLAPSCSTSTDPLCDGRGYNNYTAEVVQRIGNDSFTTGHGVLFSKTKNADSSPFVWVIDAHPENINTVDFLRPNGTPSMISVGDYRQLSDATFNAGLNSGSQYETVDAANSLHLYVIDREVGADGVLTYTIGVQNPAGAGPHTRGVSVAHTDPVSVSEHAGYCNFPLTNTGVSAPTSPTLHPEDVTAYLNGDVFRLSTSAEGSGWHAQLANALATASFGQTVSVPVYVTRDDGSDPDGVIRLTATSVSDASKTSTATCPELDLTPPVTTASLSPAPVNGWYPNPTVTLSATDNDVGVDYSEYRLDGGAWTTYTGPFQITVDGDHVLEYRSIDLDGNLEAIKAFVESFSTTTLFSASSAGATNIKVVSVPGGLSLGNTRIDIGTGAVESVTLTAIGTPGVTTTLAALSLPLDTNIKLTSVAGLSAGDSILVDSGALQETRTIMSVGTAGAAGTGVTLTAALNLPHQSGAAVVDPGSGLTFAPALAQAHASGDPVTFTTTRFRVDGHPPTITITAPAAGATYAKDSVVAASYGCDDAFSGVESCAGTVADGQPIDTSSSGSHTFTVDARDLAGNERTKTITYSVSGPTAVTLRAFTATRSRGSVVLRWRMASSAQNLGFNVYRARGALRVKLNRRLIAGTAGRGHAYLWRDRAPVRQARYWLQEVRLDGKRVLHGPVEPRR